MFDNLKCRLGIHARQTNYRFTYYDDPIYEEYPSLIAHYNVTFHNCKKVWYEKYAFLYDNVIISKYSTHFDKALKDAKAFKGNWHYIDVELPAEKASKLANEKLKNT